MIKSWQLQDAKNKFSRVVEDAVNDGPQIVTKRGVEVAVVISFVDYQKLTVTRGKLSSFFRDSPLVGADLDLARDKSDVREGFHL